jgi:hypothetical protein|tara:strand:- start:7761 stop:8639 length:879 start_codon:yes stop_codon:yes gene_type:complete
MTEETAETAGAKGQDPEEINRLARQFDAGPAEDENAIDRPRPGTMAITLPCGYLDEAGELHRDVVIRELSGEEEDIIRSKGPMIPRFNQVLANCTESIGTIRDEGGIFRAVSQLTSADREWMTIGIRRCTVGDKFEFEFRCPRCPPQDKVPPKRMDVDLSELEWREMPDPSVRDYLDEVDGYAFAWHVLDSRDDAWMESVQGKVRNALASAAMLARVDKVDGKALAREGKQMTKSIKLLQRLPSRVRSKLRRLFLEREGGVDLTLKVECGHCYAETEFEVPMGEGFFAQQET